jgi:hypothetical protein
MLNALYALYALAAQVFIFTDTSGVEGRFSAVAVTREPVSR